MRATYDPDLDLARKHRLCGTAGNNEYELRIKTIFSEEALLMGDPKRRRVAAHCAVNKRKSSRNIGGANLDRMA